MQITSLSKLPFIFLLFFYQINSFSQMSTDALSSLYREFDYKKNEFNNLIKHYNRYSLELIQENDEQLILDEKTVITDEIGLANEGINEMINELKNQYGPLYLQIEKDIPYVSQECVLYHAFFDQLFEYLTQLELEFKTKIEAANNAFSTYLGKKDLSQVKSSDNTDLSILDEITTFPILNSSEVIEFFKNQKPETIKFLEHTVLTDDILYKNQHKFMKKNKLDSLWGYYSTESLNAFFVRERKTKNIGLYEAGFDFNLKGIVEIFDSNYDTVDFDPAYDDWGIERWTTAIAKKDGHYSIAEKSQSEDESFGTITVYPTSYSQVKIPRSYGGQSYGFLAVKDPTGLWALVDIDKDSVVSPKYVLSDMIPGFDQTGKLESWRDRNDDVNINYYPDLKIESYSSNQFKYEFYSNGQFRSKAQAQKNGENFDYIAYYENGQINAIGEVKGNNLLFGTDFVNRLVIFDEDGNKYRSMYFDSTDTWIDSTFYPNGNLHATGKQKNVFTGAIYNLEFLTTSNTLVRQYDYQKDGEWSTYYYSGKLKSKGSIKDSQKMDDWVYYNPFGERTNDLFKRTVDTEMIFPFRLQDLTSKTIVSVHNKQINRAFIYDYYRFNPPIYELWDTKNNRQLSGNYLVPLHGLSFENDTLLIGSSLEYDGPHWYDLKNKNLCFPKDVDFSQLNFSGDPKLNDTLNLSSGKFDITEKLKMNRLCFENGKLNILDDSVVFTFNLHSGALSFNHDSTQTSDIDTIYRKAYEIEELYYAESYNVVRFVDRAGDKFDIQKEGGYVPSGNNRNEIPIVIVNNGRENQKIYLDKYYDANKLIFENNNKDAVLERYVKFECLKNGQFVFYTPDNYYFGSKDINEIVFFKQGDNYFEFEQFDLKYNRPDIILDRLGYADKSLIEAYHQAYLKRLKKMGFTEEMLQDDFHLPEIKIENFEKLPTLNDQGSIQLKLELNDTKYKLDRINIWVNDVAVYGAQGISLRDKNTKSYKTTLPVELAKGNNKVQVSVLNQAGAESYKKTFEVKCSVGKEKPNLYLITIGASEFLETDYNLNYAAKDANDIAALFKQSKVYEKVFVETLVNQQVTKENILKLKAFLEKAGINDEVLVFIAGHGILDDHLDYYFATHQMNFKQPNENGLAYGELESLLDGIKPLKKTLLIDACHSGEIDKDEVKLVAANQHHESNIKFRAIGNTVSPKLGIQNISELSKSLFTDLRKGTGATIISSAGGIEFAMEGDDWSNGLFTYCFINGIKTKAADYDKNGEIWLSEIKQYVSSQVMLLSGGEQQPTSRIENQTVDFRIW